MHICKDICLQLFLSFGQNLATLGSSFAFVLCPPSSPLIHLLVIKERVSQMLLQPSFLHADHCAHRLILIETIHKRDACSFLGDLEPGLTLQIENVFLLN